MGGVAIGPEEICKCQKYRYEKPQVRNQTCMDKKYPKCQTQMTRGKVERENEITNSNRRK